MEKKFLSTTELAKILGISRIAVYKKIKKGEIKATKVGGNYIINKKDLGIIRKDLTKKEKEKIDKAIDKIVKEYGETLKMLERT
jgi:excisionase family DNA binding protein